MDCRGCWGIVPLVIAAGLADWLFHLDSVIRATLLAALTGRLSSAWAIGAYSVPCSSGSPTSISPCGSRNGGPVSTTGWRARSSSFDWTPATIAMARRPCAMRPFDRRSRKPARSIFARSSSPSRSSGRSALPRVRWAWAQSSCWLRRYHRGSRCKRLFVPFGATSWPRRTHLVLDEGLTTLKVARGDSFTLASQGSCRR